MLVNNSLTICNYVVKIKSYDNNYFINGLRFMRLEYKLTFVVDVFIVYSVYLNYSVKF